jgi:hypothetical protein
MTNTFKPQDAPLKENTLIYILAHPSREVPGPISQVMSTSAANAAYPLEGSACERLRRSDRHHALELRRWSSRAEHDGGADRREGRHGADRASAASGVSAPTHEQRKLDLPGRDVEMPNTPPAASTLPEAPPAVDIPVVDEHTARTPSPRSILQTIK